MKLKDQTVLITGGASGIGLALARRFADRGNTVIVCGRRRQQLDEAMAAIPALGVIRADLSDATGRMRFADEIRIRFPGLSMLVNNAGIQQRPAPLTEPQDWDAHRLELAINLEAPMHLSILLAPLLARQPDAAIINITSGLAFVPVAAMPTYCATKAALHSFTLSLRHQLRKTSVSVVELAPPAVNTDLGGKGLHDFGVPVDDFADHAFARLEAGDEEIGYQFSDQSRMAGRDEQAKIFARMNPA